MQDLIQIFTGALWWLLQGGQTGGMGVRTRLLGQRQLPWSRQAITECQAACAHLSMDVLPVGVSA